jgi:hypothetical protein
MGALLQPKINIHVLIIKNNVCSLKKQRKGARMDHE